MPSTHSLLLLLLFALVGADGSSIQAAELRLTENGQTRYVLFVGASATPAERQAADELASVLSQVTGSPFAPITSLSGDNQHVIAIGPEAAQRIAPNLDLTNLGDEGTLVTTHGESLILTGGIGAPRGTLYAVYGFLQDEVGCRWWSPTAADIPRNPSLNVTVTTRRHLPAFEYRDIFIHHAADPDWAAHNRCNGVFSALDARHGGAHGYAAIPGSTSRYRNDRLFMVHTFNRLLPPEEHFASHPEWFSEIAGVRQGPPAKSQWCLTNRALLNACIDRVRNALRNSPPDTIVSVSQNDWAFRCQCHECLVVEQEEGSPSGPILRFVNAVASAIKDEFPHASIDTLAYQYSRQPPRVTRPLPNVIVRLCSIEANFSRSYEHPANSAFLSDLEAWHRICNRLYIWDYVINFDDYLAPFPDLRTLGPNLQLFARTGVKGVLPQGSYQSPGGDFAELRAWVLARLLWDPSLDGNLLINEFITGYYREAAPMVSMAIDLLHHAAEACEDPLTTSGNLYQSYLNDANVLLAADHLLAQAESLAAKDKELLQRVRGSRLPFRYALLRNYERIRLDAHRRGLHWSAGSYQSISADVRATCTASKITRFSERSGGDAETVLKRFDFLASAPDMLLPPLVPGDDLPRFSFGPRSFFLRGIPPAVDILADPQASQGMAVRMTATHRDWLVQAAIPPAPQKGDNTPWYIAVAVRAERNGGGGGGGIACESGIYDMTSTEWVARTPIELKRIEHPTYQLIPIGRSPLNATRYVWVAPVKNPDLVRAIWVDHLVFSRVPFE